jgi:Gpi18-like mannosyltransferase
VADAGLTTAPTRAADTDGEQPRPGLRGSWSALSWWGRALAVFAASRLVTTLLYLWVGTQGTTASRAGPHPDLVTLATAWDGQWYWYVAVHGYPAVLPLTASGAVDTNQWAFLPLYPYLVKALSLGVTAAWPPVAVLVSLAAGFVAAVLLSLLLRPRIGAGRADFAVALFAFSPLAFVLQAAYAESLGLALLLGALCLVDRHRYAAAIPVTVALAFTRPDALPLALAIGLHLLVRIRGARAGRDPLPRSELVAGVVLTAVTLVAGLAWTWIAAAATGVPDAYLRTEAAWRALWMGDSAFALFTPWWFAAHFWTERAVGSAGADIVAVLLLVVVVGGFVALLLSPAARLLGALNRLWAASYALYLLAVFFPQSSLFRLLMPMAPLTGALVPRRTAARAALLVACTAMQALWLWCTYGPFQVYWSVP